MSFTFKVILDVAFLPLEPPAGLQRTSALGPPGIARVPNAMD
jgi:hypothetical protein